MRSLRAWLALPSPSRWLIRTIRLGYAIQFARRPPKFRGVHFTSVKAVDTHVLRAEIAVLLAKDAIELVPPADMRSGFYSPYFIVPKKSGGLRPILDLRVLSKLAPVQRISFLGMELDSVEQSARLTEERAQSVLNCLNTFRGRTAVPLKLFQRLLGHMAAAAAVTHARLASYETASALASWPSPEMGVATRHVPSGNHSGMPQNLQPVVRPLVPSGRSSPRAGVPACCSLHGCLCHRLGGHVQRAGSVRGVDGPPTTLAHQLPRVASSIPCPGPPEGAVTGQICAGPYGQYCDRCVHQPFRRSALPSHVATRPPSPPLESEASEVASRHSCPWCAQPCG